MYHWQDLARLPRGHSPILVAVESTHIWHLQNVVYPGHLGSGKDTEGKFRRRLEVPESEHYEDGLQHSGMRHEQPVWQKVWLVSGTCFMVQSATHIGASISSASAMARLVASVSTIWGLDVA